jgi:hypothetical protein
MFAHWVEPGCDQTFIFLRTLQIARYEHMGFQPYEITYELLLLQPDCAPHLDVDTL